MIDWMQKHRNYLLITIWISTIAFISAGSTGWGSYNLANAGDTVARVGDYDITVKELNKEYSQLRFYVQLQNQSISEDELKTLNLQNKALDNLINRKYILNFAKEINLITTSDEVINNIVETKDFHVDGNFSKKKYKEVMLQRNTSPLEYEYSVSENILLSKILKIFNLGLVGVEKEVADLNSKLEDKIKILVLDSSKMKVQPTKKELKVFYKKHKQEYITNIKYIVSSKKIKWLKTKPTKKEIKEYYKNNKLKFEDEDGKIQKLARVKKQVIEEINKEKTLQKAKRMYYDVKNKKIKTNKILTFEKKGSLMTNAYKEISKYKKDEYIKPVEVKDGYIVGSIKDIVAPRVKTYKEAKKVVNFYLTEQIKMNKLNEKAKKKLKKFKGKMVGYVSKKNYFEKLSKFGLDKFETNNFIFKLMSTDKVKGYFVIDKKVVLYKIISQRLVSKKSNKLKLDSLDELKNIDKNDDVLLNIKSRLVEEGVLKYLKTRYEVKYFAKLST
jgi:peptidyl-prolyl cis-trans isomerase D